MAELWEELELKVDRLGARLREAQTLVDTQAEDAALWFEAGTAPEAYLQEALRRLHRVIEEAPGG